MNSKTLQINGVDPTLEWVEKEENCSSNVSEFPNSEPKNLVYLKTPDEKFHIVYDKRSIYMDVYERTPCDNSSPWWKYDKVEHLFTLRRDTYNCDTFYPIFYKVEDQWRLVFNRRYEGMSVYELPSGKELFKHIKPSEFLGNLVELDIPDYKGRFYFAFSWIWGRHETPCILDMEKIANEGKSNKVYVIGKYYNYIVCNHNDDFDENELNKFFVSKIEKNEDSFEITFELKDDYVVDMKDYEEDYDNE